MNRWFRIFATILWIGVATASCSKRIEGPNVVLITLDTTRADRLGTMGYKQAQTPVLDALATRGAVFERAYSSAPITLPSHTTMLTGLEPNRHRVHNNGAFVAPPSLETLPERLKERGYRTGAFVSAFVIDRAFGLDQGFDVYDSDTPQDYQPPIVMIPKRNGSDTTDNALTWVKGVGDAPYFLWVHYYDVHIPRYAPAPFNKIPDRYDGALAYVDSQIGRLLADVEKTANGRETLIIVTADHGESLGAHGELTHGGLVYDSSLHVPMIVAGRGFPAGTRSRNFARTSDVTPTVLAAVGAPLPTDLDGRPLQNRLAKEDEAETAYFETMLPSSDFGWARLAGIRTPRWKLTGEPLPVELFDVMADPEEAADRATQAPDEVARLTKAFEAIRAAPLTERSEMPAEVEEKLAALGYVAQAQRFEPGKEPDPRTAIGAITLVQMSRTLLSEGKVGESIEMLELFGQSPIAAPIAWRMLGPLYVRAGRYDDAVETYKQLAASTNNIQIEIQMAGALLMAERATEALELLDEIEKASPARASLLQLLRGRALLAVNKPEEAIKVAAPVLEEDPWNDAMLEVESAARAKQDEVAEIGRLQQLIRKAPKTTKLVETRGWLARLLHRRGRDREARELIDAVANPPLEQQALLADIAAAHGDVERAVKIYEKLVALLPEGVDFARSLARLYVGVGRHDDALKTYERVIAANPKDPSSYVDRGAQLFRLKRVAEAEQDYRKALALDERQPEASFNLSLLLLRKGADGEKEAEKWLLKAVEQRPEYAKAHYHLARLYNARKDPRAATHAEKAAAASSAARTAAAGAASRGLGRAGSAATKVEKVEGQVGSVEGQTGSPATKTR